MLKLKVNDEWVEDVMGIKRAMKGHFEKLYREESVNRLILEGIHFKQVSMEENEMLTTPFSIDEVKEVVWECDGNKRPGPDGFNFNFIRSCWEIISPKIMKFFEEFQRLAKLPKAVSASFLALIPKTKSPQGLNEYRLISLIGCLYKLLVRVLARRLKKVLKNIISDCQNAFHPGRNILDGVVVVVVVVNEIIDMAKRKKRDCVVLKANFEKAYDSVSWS